MFDEMEIIFTSTGTIIPPLAPLHVFVPALEVNQTVSSNAYKITLNGFMLFNSRGMNIKKKIQRDPWVPLSTRVNSCRTVPLIDCV
jgi:hypothetical protein